MARKTDTAILIRCTRDQKARLERACAQLVAGAPGAKLPVTSFVLLTALERADAIVAQAGHPTSRRSPRTTP